MGTSLTPSHPARHQYRFFVVSTWVQFKQGVEHLQDGVFMHELLHVTMSYCLDIAGIVAYRTALAVLLLLSDGILWIGKHHTNRQVSYHTPPSSLDHSHIPLVSHFLSWKLPYIHFIRRFFKSFCAVLCRSCPYTCRFLC